MIHSFAAVHEQVLARVHVQVLARVQISESCPQQDLHLRFVQIFPQVNHKSDLLALVLMESFLLMADLRPA